MAVTNCPSGDVMMSTEDWSSEALSSVDAAGVIGSFKAGGSGTLEAELVGRSDDLLLSRSLLL